MSLEILCRCGNRVRIDADIGAQAVWCPSCNQPLSVPKTDPLNAPRTGISPEVDGPPQGPTSAPPSKETPARGGFLNMKIAPPEEDAVAEDDPEPPETRDDNVEAMGQKLSSPDGSVSYDQATSPKGSDDPRRDTPGSDSQAGRRRHDQRSVSSGTRPAMHRGRGSTTAPSGRKRRTSSSDGRRRAQRKSSGNEPATFTCPNCETQTPADALVCSHCGLPIASPRGSGLARIARDKPAALGAIGAALVIALLGIYLVATRDSHLQQPPETTPSASASRNRPRDDKPGETTASSTTKAPADDPSQPPRPPAEESDPTEEDDPGSSATASTWNDLGPHGNLVERLLSASTSSSRGAALEALQEANDAGLEVLRKAYAQVWVPDDRESLARALYHLLTGEDRDSFLEKALSDRIPAVCAWAALEASEQNDLTWLQKIDAAVSNETQPSAFGRAWARCVKGAPLPTRGIEQATFARHASRSGSQREAISRFLSGDGGAATRVADALTASSAPARRLAWRVLRERCGQDFGYTPDADAEILADAGRSWRAFTKQLVQVRDDLAHLARDRDKLLAPLADSTMTPSELSDITGLHHLWIQKKRQLLGRGRGLVPVLLAILREGEVSGSSSSGHRTAAWFHEALSLLGTVAGPEDLPILWATFTRDARGAGSSRQGWALAIAHAGGLDAVPMLLRMALEHRDLVDLTNVAHALGEIGGNLGEAGRQHAATVKKLVADLANLSGRDWTGAVTCLLLLERQEAIDEVLRSSNGAPPDRPTDNDLLGMLVSCPGSRVMQRLVDLVTTPNTSRSRIADALGQGRLAQLVARMAAPGDGKYLVAAWQQDKGWGRYTSQILDALGRSGGSKEAKLILTWLPELRNPQLELEAGWAIAAIGTSRTANNARAHFVGQPRFNAYRVQVASLLNELGGKDALPILRELAAEAEAAATTWNETGRSGRFPRLDSDAILLLGRLGSTSDARVLETLLTKAGDSPYVNRTSLIIALGHLASPSSGSKLATYLYPTVPQCLPAAISLGRLGSPDAAKRILALLDSPEASKGPLTSALLIAASRANLDRGLEAARKLIRDGVASGDLPNLALLLGHSSKEDDRRWIRGMLHHPAPTVRACAIRGLSQSSEAISATDIRAISALLMDPDPAVRVEAAVAALRLDQRTEGPLDAALVGARSLDSRFESIRAGIHSDAFDHPDRGRSLRSLYAAVLQKSLGIKIQARGHPPRRPPGRKQGTLTASQARGLAIKRAALRKLAPRKPQDSR